MGFGKGHVRTNRAKKNIVGSLVVKGLSIAIGMILVPMTIHYVNPVRYGIWITMSSIIVWFGFFDIGFGGGLRNKLAQAMAKGDKELARTYVSTTYAILTMIIGVVYILFLIVNPFLNWAKILNASPEMAKELSMLALIVFTFFCIRFVLQLISTILIADQKSAKSSVFNLVGSAFSIIAIFIITKTTQGSLIYLGWALGFAPVVVLAASSLWFFNREYKYYTPSLKYVKFKYAKDLMNLGLKFFVIQIASIFLYQSNNLIIAQLFGPEQVTTYAIAYKYFGMIPMAFTIITYPLTAAYTEAYYKDEIDWVRKTVKSLINIWFAFLIGSILMLVFSKLAYRIWVGKSIEVPFVLSLICFLYTIVVTWSNIFLTFINGTGKVLVQLILTVIVIFINVPLAILFAKYMHFGIGGVLMATTISFLMFGLMMPIQYRKLVNKSAKGVWNR